MADPTPPIESHAVVSPDAWIEARTQLLAREKEFTRLRDELSRQRRELPWVRVEQEYIFEGPVGKVSLSELFAGRRQLIVYHFMFDPNDDEGCPSCSFWADNFDGIDVHLNQRDVSFVAISRAPLSKIDAFKQRMGWSFTWVSSSGSDFNYDYHVSFTPEQMASGEAVFNYRRGNPGLPDREGTSVFYRDQDGEVFHTYSAYARGIDMVNGAYQFLDLVPKGRDEAGHDFPQYWVRHHDRYGS
jgi:predicted dithiol-disulfide oxidoreductase (DUF899 family)